MNRLGMDHPHLDGLDDDDVSLRDFEPSLSPVSLRHSVMTEEDSEAETDGSRSPPHGSETGFANGFDPVAWRSLRNGERNYGFFSPPDSGLAVIPGSSFSNRMGSPGFQGLNAYERHGRGRSHGGGRDEDDDLVLEQAIRTKLPKGSMSPEKGRSPSPERSDEPTMRFERLQSLDLDLTPAKSPQQQAQIDQLIHSIETPSPRDNYVHVTVNADILQRTAPIEAALSRIQSWCGWMTSSKSTFISSVIAMLIGWSFMSGLARPAAPRPAGDLVKVAGLAKSFEPLVYYSEHAVSQVHDLQATSIAVWDLGESVRTSEMKDAAIIVSGLDSLSESMKTLGAELTKFLARVDSDIDGILNVMDWAKLHLNRLQNLPPPSTISMAYDNIHESLARMNILEDRTGATTSLGSLAHYIFGMSNPQREQRMVQLLFTEFLTVLEDSIQTELQHSVTLFALFEVVDQHFLRLARTVVRSSSSQEEMHADLLSSMWTRLLGTRAAELRKFEQNRLLLRNVREKTVRDKGVLQEHNSRLRSLKSSMESLREKLASNLVRGQNSTVLTLEDQIRGISFVSDHLGQVRAQQKSKVMEILFAGAPRKGPSIDSTRYVTHPTD
jgi:hypothetical protein